MQEPDGDSTAKQAQCANRKRSAGANPFTRKVASEPAGQSSRQQVVNLVEQQEEWGGQQPAGCKQLAPSTQTHFHVLPKLRHLRFHPIIPISSLAIAYLPL